MLGVGKNTVSLAVAIIATGAFLNLAGSGMFGATAKKLARYTTRGFGAGAFTD